MNKLRDEITKRIREGRRKHTQQEVSKILGISQAVLSKIENGKREPTGADLYQLARLYKQPIATFFPSTTTRGSIANSIIPKVTDELLDHITQKIVTTFAPRRVILFGSHAWGQPTPTSDIDLLVETDALNTLKPAMRRFLVKTVCQPPLLPMDLLVKTSAELAERLALGDQFMQRIIGQGRVLYAKPTR